MEWTWNADILRQDNIKMNGATWNLECEESLDVVVTEDCRKRCREVKIAGNGSKEGQIGRAGDCERTEVITFYVETRRK